MERESDAIAKAYHDVSLSVTVLLPCVLRAFKDAAKADKPLIKKRIVS